MYFGVVVFAAAFVGPPVTLALPTTSNKNSARNY
jgi:hypothetical protein